MKNVGINLGKFNLLAAKIELADDPAVTSFGPDSYLEGTQRLPQLLELYARNLSVEGKTEDTQKFYLKEVGLFLRFLQERRHSLLPQEVGRRHALEHLEDMKSRGLKPRTLSTRRQASLTFFNWLIQWEYVEEEKFPSPRSNRRRSPSAPRDPSKPIGSKPF